MAGKLVQVATETVSSAVATVAFDQITTDDVYVIYMNNVQCATNNIDMRIQVKDGATNINTGYYRASKDLRSDSASNNNVVANGSRIDINAASGNAVYRTHQGIFYLYNFNNSSEYPTIQWETNYQTYTDVMIGQNGGCSIYNASSIDGIEFYWEGANNFKTGSQFTLYKLV
jgi:hypothetical protein